MGRDRVELLLGVSEMFLFDDYRRLKREVLHLVQVVGELKITVAALEQDVYRQATPKEIHDDVVGGMMPAYDALRKRVVGQCAEDAVNRLETRVFALENPPISCHCDRNGTAVPIGTKLLGGYMVIGYRDNGFDVTLDDGTGCQATGIYFLPTTDAVLERLPK
jgi:hypothetical protein